MPICHTSCCVNVAHPTPDVQSSPLPDLGEGSRGERAVLQKDFDMVPEYATLLLPPCSSVDQHGRVQVMQMGTTQDS
jgi:hypothetical protein